jgi:hypothetical protein
MVTATRLNHLETVITSRPGIDKTTLACKALESLAPVNAAGSDYSFRG